MAKRRRGAYPHARYVNGKWGRGWGYDRGGYQRTPGSLPGWLYQKIYDIADFEQRSPAVVSQVLVWLGWGVYRSLVRRLSGEENDGSEVVWAEATRLSAELERVSRAPWGGRWDDEDASV